MIKNVLHTFFTRIFSALANLAIAIIISNVYGASVKGEQGLILTSITLISLLTAIIGSGSLIYLTSRYKTVHLLVPSYIWNLVVCLSVYHILTFSHILSHDLSLHTSLLTFILTMSHIHSGLLMGTERIRQSNFAFLLNNIFLLGSLLVFVFVIKIPTVYAYVYALYIGYSINFLVSLVFMFSSWRSHFQPISNGGSSFWTAGKKLLKYGFLNQLDVIAQMLSFRLSYYFINHYISKSAVGVYSNAISIIESIWLISRSISMVQNARIANSRNLEYSVNITINLLKISFSLVLLAVFVLLLIPAEFYQFIFGDEFGDVRLVIVSISPGILLFSMSFILSGLFSGTGKYSYNVMASISGLLVTLMLAILLIPRFGLVGAGITASVSYIVSVSVKLIILFRRYPVSRKQLIIRKADFNYFMSLFRGKIE
ncbi:MAG: polysaccharide biosynthesis C-terminal domain-containing protein [Bacteroidales bacterium]|nr:polysaccharide biosynthesis C-terminal domain-containing protein [Bacteroidales bacterium]